MPDLYIYILYNKDVSRLNIRRNDALLVRVIECLSTLEDDFDNLLYRHERICFRKQLKGFTISDVRYNNITGAFIDTDVVDPDNIQGRQPPSRICFVEKHFAELIAGCFGIQLLSMRNLYRDRAINEWTLPRYTVPMLPPSISLTTWYFPRLLGLS